MTCRKRGIRVWQRFEPDRAELIKVDMVQGPSRGPAFCSICSRRKNGEVFPNDIRLCKGVYFGQDVLIAIVTDITERKRAEDSIRQSEEKFRTLLENIPDMVLVHRDGNILYVNPALTEIMGTTSDETINTSVFDHIAPEYSKTVSGTLRNQTAAGPPLPFEIEILSKTGERCTVVRPPYDD